MASASYASYSILANVVSFTSGLVWKRNDNAPSHSDSSGNINSIINPPTYVHICNGGDPPPQKQLHRKSKKRKIDYEVKYQEIKVETNEEIIKWKAEIELLKGQIVEMDEKQVEERHAARSLFTENDRKLKQKLNKIKVQLAALNTKNECLKTEIVIAEKQQLEERTAMQTQIDHLRDENTQLLSEIDKMGQLNGQKDELEKAKMDALMAQNAELDKQNSEYESQLRKVNDEIRHIEAKHVEIESHCEQQVSQVKENARLVLSEKTESLRRLDVHKTEVEKQLYAESQKAKRCEESNRLLRQQLSQVQEDKKLQMQLLLRCEKSERRINTLHGKIDQRAAEMSKDKDSFNDRIKKIEARKYHGTRPNTREITNSNNDNDGNNMRQRLNGALYENNIGIKLSDVAGLKHAKQALSEIPWPSKYPRCFTNGLQPCKSFLLYGPPGTGKSYLAKAVASDIGARLFYVSVADVLSKYYGDSSNLVKALFEWARETPSNVPTIIFMDEIDCLGGRREEGTLSTPKEAITQLLLEIEGKPLENDNIILIGATNLPWTLDPALRRRLKKRICIPLPNEDARVEMIKIYLRGTNTKLGSKDIKQLAKMTDGASGSDIEELVREARMEPVRRAIRAAESRTESRIEQGCHSRSLLKKNKKVKPGPVCMKDFEAAMKDGYKTVSEDELGRFDEWTKKFGKDGS